jgi:hypothetical protein
MKLSINTPAIVRTIMIIDVVERTFSSWTATRNFELKLMILPSSAYTTSVLVVFFWGTVAFVEEESGVGKFASQEVFFEGQQVPSQF